MTKLFLLCVALDEGAELYIPQIVKLWRLNHLDVFKSQRNLLLLSKTLSLLLKRNVLTVLKPTLKILFFDRTCSRLMGLPCTAESMIKIDGRLKLVTYEFMLKVILVISRNDLLVYGF